MASGDAMRLGEATKASPFPFLRKGHNLIIKRQYWVYLEKATNRDSLFQISLQQRTSLLVQPLGTSSSSFSSVSPTTISRQYSFLLLSSSFFFFFFFFFSSSFQFITGKDAVIVQWVHPVRSHLVGCIRIMVFFDSRGNLEVWQSMRT